MENMKFLVRKSVSTGCTIRVIRAATPLDNDRHLGGNIYLLTPAGRPCYACYVMPTPAGSSTTSTVEAHATGPVPPCTSALS